MISTSLIKRCLVLLGVFLTLLSVAVFSDKLELAHGQSPTPAVKTDRAVYPEPALPALPAAGGKFNDKADDCENCKNGRNCLTVVCDDAFVYNTGSEN